MSIAEPTNQPEPECLVPGPSEAFYPCPGYLCLHGQGPNEPILNGATAACPTAVGPVRMDHIRGFSHVHPAQERGTVIDVEHSSHQRRVFTDREF